MFEITYSNIDIDVMEQTTEQVTEEVFFFEIVVIVLGSLR